METVLIVDDHDLLRHSLSALFEAHGFRVLGAASGVEGIRLGRLEHPAAAIVDFVLPGISGLDVLSALKENDPTIVDIAISGVLNARDGDAACKRAGVRWWFPKPFDNEALCRHVTKHLVRRGTRIVRPELARQQLPISKPPRLIGGSIGMCETYRLIERVGPTSAVVVIEGESGTGKELIAQAIHERSGRKGPFVAVNCAAIPRELAEAELFGSERGAFTEAVSRAGRFEQAHGGTLFLDEIADLALGAQGILLRVLDQKKVQRLGSYREVAIDARVIAATNVDLTAASAQGRFRSDLLFRLREIRIELPPLRARGEDILALIDYLLPRICGELNLSVRTIEPVALRALRTYSWPGNVRELRDVLMLACIRADDAVITVRVLPGEIVQPTPPRIAIVTSGRIEAIDRPP